MAEPTTSPEQRDGELRGGLEHIQSVMAVPALRCGLMSSSLALVNHVSYRSHVHLRQTITSGVSNKNVEEFDGYFVARLSPFTLETHICLVHHPLEMYLFTICPGTRVLRDTY